MLCMCSNVI